MSRVSAASPSPRSPLAIALALLLGVTATFLLPYLVPVAPTVSDSYLVGFHNRTCIAIFLLFLAAFSWWTGGFGLLSQPAPRAPERPSGSLLALVLVVFLALTLGEWRLLLHHPAIQEAPYFLDRLQHLASGQIPYRDFEFAYGPLLLYLPLAIARLTGLSLTAAYFSSWILQYLLGTVFIYLCLLPFSASRSQKNTLFALLAASWWAGPLCLGLNYTPFRFFLAPLLAIHLANRLAAPGTALRPVAEVLAATVLLLLVSPEQAIALLGAAILFLALTAVRTRSPRVLAQLVAILAGSGLLLLPLFRLGLFRTASAMSQGGYNFPLLPTPLQLPLFALMLVSAAALASAILRHQPLGSVHLLALLGFLLIPAAFSRPDPGHIFVNTTALTLAGFLLLAQHPSAFRRLTRAFVVFVLLIPVAVVLRSTLYAQWAYMQLAPYPAQPAGSSIPFAPFSYSLSTSADPAFRAQTGFYDGLENIITPEQVAQAVAELADLHPGQLVLPENPSCTLELSVHSLRRVLATPFIPPARHISYTLQPLCNYITGHYTLNPSLPAPPGYQLWNRKSSTAEVP